MWMCEEVGADVWGNGQEKSVLNWANICFANIVWAIRRTLKKFGEPSWFSIGRTTAGFANLFRGIRRTATKLLCSGSKMLRLTCSRTTRPVRRTLPQIG